MSAHSFSTARSSAWLRRGRIRLVAALAFGMLTAARGPAWAQPVTLDGTSGSNSSSALLSTTGDLQINLGFFSEYLVVGGGGSGGGQSLEGSSRGGAYTGGGGGGGLLTNVGGTPLQLGATSYTVTVGGGGIGIADPPLGTRGGVSGGNSVFGSLTAVGGGHGGTHAGGVQADWDGAAGGSGGGGGGNSVSNGSGGAGTVGQGFAGGSGQGGTNAIRASGGGGGAGGAGGNASSSGGTAGNGGVGALNTITGSDVYYAGGGGGGTRDGTIGTGGLGGGGNGGRSQTNAVDGTNGVNGLGGGGGGRSNSGQATNGGSGVVIVRYQGAPAGTGGSVDPGTGTALGYTLHTFTTVETTALDLSGLNLNERLGLTLTEGITGDGNLTFNGPGRLTLAGANIYTGDTFIDNGRLLATGSIASVGTVFVAAGAGLGGTGSIGGNVSFAATSIFDVVDLADPLVVGGTVAFDTGDTPFGIANLAGIDWDSVALNTPYPLISTSQTVFANLANFGFENRTSVGSGREAYFAPGSLQVIVVPEPTGLALLAVAAGIGLAGCRLRRTTRPQPMDAA